ncbi:MAG: hypothetical protein ACXVKA_15045 [Acidimicrobiia bacterium]
MSEDDAPTEEVDETPAAGDGEAEPADAAEPWVTGAPIAAQRVPGIDEAPETTYVEPQSRKNRRAVLIGLAIGLGATAIFAVVASANSSDGSKKSALASKKRLSRTSSTSTTTTTLPPDTSSTSAPAALPVAPPSTTATTAAAPPTPRATADPAAPVYVAEPLPAGVSGTLAACSWQTTNGGQYEASGTLTNAPSTTHGWTITIHWLQNGREIAQQSGVVDLAAGQSQPWSLSLSSASPPADPFSCALSAA